MEYQPINTSERTSSSSRRFSVSRYRDVRMLPLRLLPLSVVDFLFTVGLFMTGALYAPLVQYLKGSIISYSPFYSITDVFAVSLTRMVLFGIFSWSLRSPKGVTTVKKVLNFVFIFVTASLAIGKMVMHVIAMTENSPVGHPASALFLAYTVWICMMDLGFSILVMRRNSWLLSYGQQYVQMVERDDSVSPVFEEYDVAQIEVKEGEKHASVLRVLSLAAPEVPTILGGLLALFISTGTGLAMPAFFGIVVEIISRTGENATTHNLMEELLNVLIYLLVIFFVGGVATWIRGWLFTLAGQSLVARVRKLLFSTIMKQDISFFDETNTGELTNRLSSDTGVLQNSVTTNISMIVRNLASAIGAVVLLFIISWKLTLVMLSCVPLIAIVAVVYGRYVQNLRKEYQDKLADATSLAEEAISSVRIVRSFAHEKETGLSYGDKVDDSFALGKKLAFAYGLFVGVLGIFAQGAIAGVVYYGGTLVLNKALTPGSLLSFLLYTLTVAVNIATLSSLVGDFAQAVGAAERIFQLVDSLPKIPISGGTVLSKKLKGEISLKNVTFTYDTRPDNMVLKDLTLNVRSGQVVALVGPSGGGKSTIVSLIERYYDPDSGSVSIDGTNLRDLDPVWFRKKMGYVSQQPTLFADTIKNNIMYGVNPLEVTDEEVIEAAKAANAHDFIMKFGKGYDETVGEKGIMLSGGQKQRIAIARALILDPAVLLLDEATSALDAESEFMVQQAIDRAMHGRTVLVIAHRLSTVRDADLVCVINEGRVVEQGTHDQLLSEGGIYQKLVKRQLQGNSVYEDLREDAEKEEKKEI
eukprot:TRINITY_DN7117_c0_g1_i1.p1 TRINITY_DN7117_c0_g1~~TRINITY_DN7117_c0_g1_i1.p1  ORF type:complete len:811 (-),score=165.13 TRINITY_DN7117_c0_g1_i1:73-2505(-)